eukprot:2143073-Prymnesium_polylepis.1
MSTTTPYILGGLSVDPGLRRFVDQKLLPGTRVESRDFWWGLDSIVKDLHGENATLLEKRDRLQRQVDEWHRAHPAPFSEAEYTAFLRDIGYHEGAPPAFTIETQNVDAEIAS